MILRSRLEGLASRLSTLLLRLVAADILTLEQDVFRRIEEQAAELDAVGQGEQAEKLRALIRQDLVAIEGPRRGRPKKAEVMEGGAES